MSKLHTAGRVVHLDLFIDDLYSEVLRGTDYVPTTGRTWENSVVTTNGEPAALRSVAPVFSTTDVARWLEHYRGLGFEVAPHDEKYGFASLGPVSLHVSLNRHHDPATTAGCAYLDVYDADLLWHRWSNAPGGKDVEPVDTDYGTREGAHIDPDGNLLRYGSWR